MFYSHFANTLRFIACCMLSCTVIFSLLPMNFITFEHRLICIRLFGKLFQQFDNFYILNGLNHEMYPSHKLFLVDGNNISFIRK